MLELPAKAIRALCRGHGAQAGVAHALPGIVGMDEFDQLVEIVVAKVRGATERIGLGKLEVVLVPLR
ncbi:hypothetical protein D3C71_1885250 [compost metagenome]